MAIIGFGTALELIVNTLDLTETSTCTCIPQQKVTPYLSNPHSNPAPPVKAPPDFGPDFLTGVFGPENTM